jgi:hypothetical protein
VQALKFSNLKKSLICLEVTGRREREKSFKLKKLSSLAGRRWRDKWVACRFQHDNEDRERLLMTSFGEREEVGSEFTFIHLRSFSREFSIMIKASAA